MVRSRLCKKLAFILIVWGILHILTLRSTEEALVLSELLINASNVKEESTINNFIDNKNLSNPVPIDIPMDSELKPDQIIVEDAKPPRLEDLIQALSNPESEVWKTMAEKDILNSLDRQLPNLPIKYIKRKKGHKMSKDCALFPSLDQLQIQNLYWQVLTLSNNVTLYLYSAFLDDRDKNPNGSVIRILAVSDSLLEITSVSITCQIWFEKETKPQFQSSVNFKHIKIEKATLDVNGLSAYFFTCRIPSSHQGLVPLAVSVVEDQCHTPTNMLRITYKKSVNKDIQKTSGSENIGVCVKGLNDHKTHRLIEWIELIRVMEVSKFHVYHTEISRETEAVLEYFHRKRILDAVPGTLPILDVNDNNAKQTIEALFLNDCLYRNMYLFYYLAILDIDQIVVPKKDKSWPEMMRNIKLTASKKRDNVDFASINFRNTYFMDHMLVKHLELDDTPMGLDDIPDQLHMLRHIYRSSNHTKAGQLVVSFVNPDLVLMISRSDQPASNCIGGGSCTNYIVNPIFGQSQTYSNGCSMEDIVCKQTVDNAPTVIDSSLWPFREEVLKYLKQDLNRLKDRGLADS